MYYSEKETFNWADNERLKHGCARKFQLKIDTNLDGDIVLSLFHEEKSNRAIFGIGSLDGVTLYCEIENFAELQEKHPVEVEKMLDNGVKLYEKSLQPNIAN